MVFVPFFLVTALILQIGGGLFLIAGYKVRYTALMFAGMTLAINIVMHDFWNVYEGLSQAHETQNFVKIWRSWRVCWCWLRTAGLPLSLDSKNVTNSA